MNNPYSPAAGLNRFTTKLPPEVRPCGPLFGTETPEGSVAANPGTLFTNLSTSEVWLKVSGVSVTGWKLTGIAAPSATSIASAQQIFYGSATDPNGVVTAQAPAYYYSLTDQSQWNKTNSTNDDQGWVRFIGN
jgi:hypothetical protein